MSLLKKNRLAFSIGVLTLLAIGVWLSYHYVFAAPKTTNQITATYIGEAKEFNYLVTENLSNWTNKVIQLTGTVTQVNDNGVLLNRTIYCQFENKAHLQSITKNQQIVIKGKFVGFDELLMETKLNQCIIIQ
jgi:hypothetical protein